jgi:hypothetical protein
MESIQAQIDIIKNAITNLTEEEAINTIKNINPIIVMYYRMKYSFENFNKLPEEFWIFSVKDAVPILITIGDANLVKYIIEKYTYFEEEIDMTNAWEILEAMIIHYKNKNDLSNLNIINKILEDNIKELEYDGYSILNYPHVVEQYLMNPNNYYYNDYYYDSDDKNKYDFNQVSCSCILSRGDYVDIIRIFYECSQRFPDLIEFDFKIVFNCALVNGREAVMQFILQNFNYTELYSYNKSQSDIDGYEFDDTIMYSLLGSNINCVRTVIELFRDKIKDDNWEEYFKFAATYSNLEVLQFLIIIKMNIIEQIDNFYNMILEYSLCNANYENVKLALDNGAEYSTNMSDFVNDFNEPRTNDYYPFEGDFSDFHSLVNQKCNNFDIKFNECMKYIMEYDSK